MIDNRSAKLKAQIAANRKAKRYAQGGEVDTVGPGPQVPEQPTPDQYGLTPENSTMEQALLAGQQRHNEQALPGSQMAPNPAAFDPHSEALENPLVSPEDLVANAAGAPVAKALVRGAEAVGPSLVKQGARLLADEAGEVALQRGAKAAPAEMLELEHYSNVPGLTEIDPAKMGTGFDKTAANRSYSNKVSFHYLKGAEPETETGLHQAKHVYPSQIEASKVYDLSADPEGIAKGAIAENNGVINMDDIVARVRQEGYAGFRVPGHPHKPSANAVMLFEKVPVKGPEPLAEVPMYSKLENVVNTKFRQKMPSEYAKTTLANAGVSQEEMEVYGVDDFLNSRKTVTPEELKAHLEANRPEIKKHAYGRGVPKGMTDDGEYSPDNLHPDYEPSEREIDDAWDGSRHQERFYDAESEAKWDLAAEDSENPRNKYHIEQVEDPDTGETKHVVDFGRDVHYDGYGANKKKLTGEMHFESESDAQDAIDAARDRWEEDYETEAYDLSGTYDEHREASAAEVREAAHQRYLEENPPEEAPQALSQGAPASRALPDSPLSGAPKYENYRLAGGSNYREELFTGPSKTAMKQQRDIKAFGDAYLNKTGQDKALLPDIVSDLQSEEMTNFVTHLRNSSKPEDKNLVAAYDKVVPPWKQGANATVAKKFEESNAFYAQAEALEKDFNLKKMAVREAHSLAMEPLETKFNDKVNKIASRYQGQIDQLDERIDAIRAQYRKGGAPEEVTQEFGALTKQRSAVVDEIHAAQRPLIKEFDAVKEAKMSERQQKLREIDAEAHKALTPIRARSTQLADEAHELSRSLEQKDPNYTASHFGGTKPNVFVHGRSTERQVVSSDLPDADFARGVNSLHVEEIQSDAHQEARDLGYMGQAAKPFEGPVFSQAEQDAHINRMQGQLTDYMQKNNLTDRAAALADAQNAGVFSTQDIEKLQSIQKYKAHQENPSGIPEMVMAKTWDKHGFKQMLKRAVDLDKDYLTWNTGEISAKNNGTTGAAVEGQKLNYDVKYPGIVKKLVNEFDPSIKVQKVRVKADGGHTEVWGIKLTPKLKAAMRKKGFSTFAVGGMVGGAAASTQNYAEGGEVGTLSGVDDAPPPGLDALLSGPAAQNAHPLNALLQNAPVETDAPPPGLDELVAPEMQQQQYGGPGQQAIAGLEGLAAGVAGPLATGAERLMGVSGESMRGREQANPWTHGIAETAGFAGSTMLGVGEGALLAKAGKNVALASGLAHEIPAVAGAAARVVANPGMVSQIGAEAVKGAFEAALFQGGRELTEAFRNDPNQTAQTAIVDIGLATIMGTAIGGGLGAVMGSLAKTAPGVALDAAESAAIPPAVISELDRPAFEAGDLAASVRHSDTLKPAEKEGMLSSIINRKDKKNIAEIKSASKILDDAPLLEGITSDDRNVQRAEDYLLKGAPTYSSLKRQGLYNEAYAKVESAVDGVLGDPGRYSKAELGGIMQSSIIGQFEEQNAPIAALYNELKLTHEAIPLSEKSAPAIARGLADMRELTLAPRSPEGQLVARVMEEIQNLKTVDDVKWYKSQLTGSIAGKQVSSNERRIVGILADKLTDLEENSIERFAKTQMKTPEAYQKIMGLIDQRKVANAQYATFIKRVGALSDQLGKGKVYGVQDAIRFIRDLTPESVVQKLSTTKDSQFRAFFAKEFPEQNALMQEYMKGALRQGATKDGALSPRDVLTSVFGNGKRSGMEPEIQKSLFSAEELKKLNAAKVYLENFPKNFNPSGTDHAAAFRAFMASPSGAALGNARDFGLEQFIKGVKRSPQVDQAVTLGKATVAGQKLMDKSIKSFFSDVKENGPSALIPLLSQRENLRRAVDTLAQDPSRMFSMGNNQVMPEYSKAFAETSARAVEYLSSLRPRIDANAPLDNKRKPTPAEDAAYARALDIAQQPLVVLSRMKQGTLIPEDVRTIKTIYPNLYAALSNKIMSAVVEAKRTGATIPYSSRLQLTMFLGMPMDSTMLPGSILEAQAKRGMVQGQTPGQDQPAPKGNPSKLNGMPKAAATPGQARGARDQSQH